MDERNDVDKMDEVMLPGFRFHPTDEELVGFYLKRKVQQRPLSIELIKQLDIYKYDPWDLPKLATGGEKEWYFYCPRDRKYRNSARPNRVTGAGFWKATGTDRPIYSSEGNKCIGLKKSLVFYKGRAAKGIKTDWMMHEFRLPSLADSMPTKRIMDRSNSIPANDLWAICRIFKKTSSSAHRAISHSWVSPLSEQASSDELAKSSQNDQFGSQNMSLTTDAMSPAGIHLNYNNELQHASSTTNPLSFPSYRLANSFSCRPFQHPTTNGDLSLTSSFLLSPLQTLAIAKGPVDVSSALFNIPPSLLGDHFDSKASEGPGIFGGSQDHCNGFSLTSLPQELQIIDGNGNGNGNENASLKHLNGTHFDDQWETVPAIGFPYSLPTSVSTDHAWKPDFGLDHSSYPTEISTSFGSTKCYT